MRALILVILLAALAGCGGNPDAVSPTLVGSTGQPPAGSSNFIQHFGEIRRCGSDTPCP